MRIGRLIADYRWGNKISTRDLAKQIGMSSATLNRIENGENCDGATLVRLMTWLFNKNTGDMP